MNYKKILALMNKHAGYIMMYVCVSFLAFIFYHINELKREQEILIHKMNLEIKRSELELVEVKDFFFNQNNILEEGLLNEINKIHNLNIGANRSIVGLFSENNCGFCMARLISDLKDFKNENGFNNIVLLGDIPRVEFYEKLNVETNDFNYYNIRSGINIKEEHKLYPLLFVLNPSKNINHMFVPELFKEYNEKFFYDILPDLLN